jgi:aryl-alcohol dehydrogenase-like predicted oxidoreductase
VWHPSFLDRDDWRRAFDDLKRSGKVRAVGISVTEHEPDTVLDALRTDLIDAVQVIYNIFDQAPEDELFPLCQELNIGVIARVPFDEGSLGGKMTLETRFPKGDWRAGYFGKENLPKTIRRVEKLKEILPKGMSLPEMSLRFILSRPAVSTTIPGMRKPEHVRDNIAASDAGPLDKSLLAELKKHRWDRKPTKWSD